MFEIYPGAPTWWNCYHYFICYIYFLVRLDKLVLDKIELLRFNRATKYFHINWIKGRGSKSMISVKLSTFQTFRGLREEKKSNCTLICEKLIYCLLFNLKIEVSGLNKVRIDFSHSQCMSVLSNLVKSSMAVSTRPGQGCHHH